MIDRLLLPAYRTSDRKRICIISLLLRLSTVDIFSAPASQQNTFTLGGAKPIQTEAEGGQSRKKQILKQSKILRRLYRKLKASKKKKTISIIPTNKHVRRDRISKCLINSSLKGHIFANKAMYKLIHLHVAQVMKHLAPFHISNWKLTFGYNFDRRDLV